MPSARLVHSSLRPSVATLLLALAAAMSLVVSIPARAGDSDWPRQFDSPSGSFVVYEPQPENLEGDVLTGRAAFSLRENGDAHPTFGVIWYTQRVEIDRGSGTVSAHSLEVTKVRLPGITASEAARYEMLMEAQAARWDLSGSLEELQAGLTAAKKEQENVAGLDNAPPRILFKDRRAILVVYDGTPILEPIEGSDLERAVNTPYAVVYDPDTRYYYLNGANLWYRAKDPLGPWVDISNPPAAVRKIVPPDTSTDDQVEGTPPDVLTATEPTELIATDGAPRYAPLVDDELLYLTNTESDVIFEVGTQRLYVLISGRWFRARSMDGPWSFVRGDELPASFKEVPLDSPKGNILASVAGTEQAEDAIADAEIPQTSAIRRDDRSFETTYDGDPEFALIAGTDLQYAVNTDADVILADGRYYACDQGVWYISNGPDGPWSVSDTRPVGVEDIPPSCPVYDVRYVHIYDYTPEVVYVGYLPGYLGCYPYYGTVLYGTGYRYGSWRSRNHYYPRRFTWGFHARYNPWLSRWSFGFSYGTGFLHAGTRWHSNPPAAQTTRWRSAPVTQSNVRSKWFGPGGYGGPQVAPRVERRVDRVRVRSIASPIARPEKVADDVFAGRTERVYRPDRKGSEVRTGTSWKPARPAVEHRAPENKPPEQPAAPPRERIAPRPEKPMPPTERTSPPRERTSPPRERHTPRPERPAPPEERPKPPEQPAPEREYRARERAETQEPRKEQQRSRENARPERNR